MNTPTQSSEKKALLGVLFETVKEPRHCVPLGAFRQFGSALRRGFVGFSAENPTGYDVLTIITQITAKNDPVGTAALSGPYPLVSTNLTFLTR